MTETREKSVFFVGKQGPVDKALNDILVRRGIPRIHAFLSADDCLQSLSDEECDLLVVDLDGDTAHGLRLLAGSRQIIPQLPKLALVDRGDIPTAVQAIRAGAFGCLEKPVDRERLVAEINDLLRQTGRDLHHPELALTPMETTVLHFILEGKTNCATAQALHRSPRTIEVHRGHIMRKLGVSNMVDLVKAAISMGLLQA